MEKHHLETWRAAIETADYTHLSYEQIAAYADEEADDVEREIIAGHLAVCRNCAAELQQVQAARAELLPHAVREPQREGAPVLRERLSAWRRQPVLRWAIPFAGVVTAALIAIQFWSLGRENRELRARLAASQQENSKWQQRAADAGKTAEELRRQLAELQPTYTPQRMADAVALNDASGQVTLDSQGNVAGLGALAPARQQMLRAALTGGRVEQPALVAELAGKADALSGGGKRGVAFALVHPVGKIIAADRPTLRWQPLAGATGYTVAVYDENLNRVAASESVTTTSWTVTPPLARGQVFNWQVRAIKDGREIVSPAPPAPEAKFKVLEQGRLNGLNRAKREHPNSHLLIGLLYAEAGLMDEAEGELRALVQLNPNSELARKLLQSVGATRKAK